MIGEGYTKDLEGNRYLDITVYPSKWTSLVSMSLWEKGNGIAIRQTSKRFFNYNKFFPPKISEIIAKRSLNKQSLLIADIKIAN